MAGMVAGVVEGMGDAGLMAVGVVMDIAGEVEVIMGTDINAKQPLPLPLADG